MHNFILFHSGWRLSFSRRFFCFFHLDVLNGFTIRAWRESCFPLEESTEMTRSGEVELVADLLHAERFVVQQGFGMPYNHTVNPFPGRLLGDALDGLC